MSAGIVNVDVNPGGILKAIFDGIDALFTSDEEKQQLRNDAIKAAQENRLKEWAIQAGLLTAQIEVNKTEAASGNPWVAGWRPSIGWTCSAALFFQFVLSPIGMWAANIMGHPLPAPPKLDDMLWELMLGMLGIGALRTVEKVRGVAK